MPLSQRSVEIRGWESALSNYAEADLSTDCFEELGDNTQLLGSHPLSDDVTWLAIIYKGEPAIIYTPTHIYIIPPERVDSPDISAVLTRYLPSDARVTRLSAGSYQFRGVCEYRMRSQESAPWEQHAYRGEILFGNGIRMVRIERSS